MIRKCILTLTGILCMSIFMTACSKGGSTYTGGTGSTGTNPDAVTIQNFSFNSGELHISAGTTVTWTNLDNTTHTVTADDGSFTSGNIGAGQKYTHNFPTAGTIHYHCSFHPMMTGAIVVQ
jgi:plastocyanin